jgi:hypothetical protein
MATFAFSGGVNAVQGFGNRQLVGFSGTWASGDKWSFELVSPTLGNVMVGSGQLAGLAVTAVLTLNGRIYLAQGSQFAFSDNNLPTKFEEQNPGAGFVSFLSQFGSQDAVGALSALQGRLAVFGRYSIQIWVINGDPKQFNIVQTLNNIGTNAAESVQQLGDYDCIFLDPSTGIRSLRSREVTLNGYIDDIGLPVDAILQAVLAGYDASGACGIVDPVSKRYWLFLKDTIYVLNLFRSQKISAWTTFKSTYDAAATTIAPADDIYGSSNLGSYDRSGLVSGQVYIWTKGNSTSNSLLIVQLDGTQLSFPTAVPFIMPDNVGTAQFSGPSGTTITATLTTVVQTAFTPEKFIVYNGLIYVRATSGQVFVYGGTGGVTYDSSQATCELPYLDHGKPVNHKTAKGIDAAFGGAWNVYAGMNPADGSTALEKVLLDGSTTSPDEGNDATFDKGNMSYEAQGTHFKIKFVSSKLSNKAAWVSQVIFKYKEGTQK